MENPEGLKPFKASEAIGPYRRVQIIQTAGATQGQIRLADADEVAHGVTGNVSTLSGEFVTVRLFHGTRNVVMSSSATAYADIWEDADGEYTDVDPADSSPIRGFILEAAAGDGSIVEAIVYEEGAPLGAAS